MSLPPTSVLPAAANRDVAADRPAAPAARPEPGVRASAANDADAGDRRAALAVEEVRGSLSIDGVSVQFELDRELNEMVVKVIDPATGELIRQMPSEEAIRVATVMGRLRGLLVERTA
ncbi:flagellar protein FlaG [Ramlibacter tataouinensis]|uniref:flagellar protein FlaG n=1 Tax=Ramlibacter tataouinensis TaxID=94132 RepID=UPI0022F3A83E|nr:flagellar protein FlaG [Ramlibacter tataouinensis]WBY00621.1 flagellar protein FlaG [Ramlibacter tataouinensis]